MLNKLNTKLTIRTRLKIFLLLPWFIIFFLGINDADDYLNNIEQARQVTLLVSVAGDIDDLIYQLQKERGLSIANIDHISQKNRLQQQRAQTDSRIQQYVTLAEKIKSKALNIHNVTNELVINNILDNSLTSVAALAVQRKKIDECIISNCNSYDNFTYYSHFIEQLLRLVSQVLAQPATIAQNRNSIDFLTLLYLQEKSGKERGALNRLLHAKQLYVSELKQVISYSDEQKKLINDLLSVSKLSNQVLVRRQLDSDNNQQVVAVRRLLNQKLIRADQLARLGREIGYGGLIHYFKKYTLRGQAGDRQNFLNSLASSQNYIALLMTSDNFTSQDKQALTTIDESFTRYYQHILQTDSLTNAGKNRDQIDNASAIDDKQAIAAVKQLQRNDMGIAADYWWQLSTQRIDNLKEISDHIHIDMQNLASGEEQQAIERLILFLAIFLLLFILTLYFSFLSVKRIISELKYIRNGMTTMQLERNFNQPLIARGNDEITDMVIAFNHMLAEINKSEEEQKISAAVFQHASEAIMITDANNKIETVNPAFCRISGYSAAEVIGKSPNILSSGKHDERFYQQMWQSLEQKNCWQGEVWNKRKSGELFPEYLAISVVRDKSRKPLQYISLFSDITKYKQYEENIWLQANYDSLTGLPNRDLLLDRLRVEITRIKGNVTGEIAILFIDLDRFKHVNDTWGHNSGDELLTIAAERLKECIREKDTVARFGGDEFVVLLVGDFNRAAIKRIVNNILAKLSMPFHLANKNEAVVSASIGITIASEHGDNAEVLVKNADTAMYQAKVAGRNTYQFFTQAMNETLSRRMYIEQALRQAIKEQEFVLHYQPVVELSHGEIVGVEALIRWQHPTKGLIYPDSFINIAEETGLIEQIGQWVIEQACADLSHWQALGLMLHVAVNVSSRQCKQTSQTPIKEVISRALNTYNIAPSSLKVEITESLLMDNSQEMITTLQDIRSLGVAIHMDDFGTGYSSLSYLKHFPINVLKIDRAFIDGAIDDKTDASLVEAVVLIGHSLSLQLVGEGIETQAHYNYLRELGCDYGQGYFISRPIIASELITLCQESSNSPRWLS